MCAHCRTLLAGQVRPRTVCLACGRADVAGPLCCGCAPGQPEAVSLLPFRPCGVPLIHRLKFGNERGIARSLAGLLAAALPLPEPVPALCPVPLCRRRRRRRGYNQAALLAEDFARRRGLAVLTPLRRIRSTPPQARLRAAERRENLEGAFRARSPREGEPRRLFLLDDVVTTGATLQACREALGEAGWEVCGAGAVFHG